MIGLREAMAHVRRLQGETVVVKLGGALLERPVWVEAVADDLAVLAGVGVRIVVVHGGGPQLDARAEALDLPTRRVAGRRVTDPALIDAALLEWRGRLSSMLVRAIQAKGASAIGLAGMDGGLVEAVRRPPTVMTDDDGSTREVDFGEVGDVTGVNAGLLLDLLDHGIPVVSPLAKGEGGQVLNVNADTVAAHLAMALGARSLVLALQAGGLLSDPTDPASVLARVTLAEAEAGIQDGSVTGGMRPKLAAIRVALDGGVRQAHLVDGRVPGVLLNELLTNEGHGTLVVP